MSVVTQFYRTSHEHLPRHISEVFVVSNPLPQDWGRDIVDVDLQCLGQWQSRSQSLSFIIYFEHANIDA